MFKLLAFIVLILAFIFTFYSNNERENLDEWINSNRIILTNDNTTLNEFKIEFNQAEWNFLSNKLNNTRYFKILDEKKVKRNQYGFDPEFAQMLVDYWRQEFNWSKQIDFLNKYPQFKLIINDEITIHYIRLITNKHLKKQIKLMLIDGWPGSFTGFLKLIDYISFNFTDLSFDIIVPSIPGYGYSNPLNKPLDTFDTAFYFDALMRFIHKDEKCKYFVKGEDWGSIVATNLALLFPDRVKGIHITLPTLKPSFTSFLGFIATYLCPSFVLFPEEINNLEKYSIKHLFKVFWNDFGYFHLQSTRPDTLSLALTDSPAGLLAYILEKYSYWTFDFKNQVLNTKDGSLNKFDKDELLTIVTIYWMTNSISSSIRYYR